MLSLSLTPAAARPPAHPPARPICSLLSVVHIWARAHVQSTFATPLHAPTPPRCSTLLVLPPAPAPAAAAAPPPPPPPPLSPSCVGAALVRLRMNHHCITMLTRPPAIARSGSHVRIHRHWPLARSLTRMHVSTHARMHARMHARTHARTHARRHGEKRQPNPPSQSVTVTHARTRPAKPQTTEQRGHGPMTPSVLN